MDPVAHCTVAYSRNQYKCGLFNQLQPASEPYWTDADSHSRELYCLIVWGSNSNADTY